MKHFLNAWIRTARGMANRPRSREKNGRRNSIPKQDPFMKNLSFILTLTGLLLARGLAPRRRREASECHLHHVG